MEYSVEKTPIWYWIVAIFFLLWNVLGVLSFLGHTFITDDQIAQLPENEQALYGQYPIWTTIVFAIAVISGLMGSFGLIMKKKWSRLIFIISLCAIIPQMAHNVFFTRSIEVYGVVQATIMPIFVVVFGVFLVWFSTMASKRNWLK